MSPPPYTNEMLRDARYVPNSLAREETSGGYQSLIRNRRQQQQPGPAQRHQTLAKNSSSEIRTQFALEMKAPGVPRYPVEREYLPRHDLHCRRHRPCRCHRYCRHRLSSRSRWARRRAGICLRPRPRSIGCSHGGRYSITEQRAIAKHVLPACSPPMFSTTSPERSLVANAVGSRSRGA